MNEFMKTVLSLSVSGTLLLLIVLGLKQLYKNKLSRRWQYYIWIIVALRFLLPFAPETTIVGSLFASYETEVATNESPTGPNPPGLANTDNHMAAPIQTDGGAAAPLAAHKTVHLMDCLFFVWSAAALALFIRKIVIYRSFIRSMKAGNTEVSDIKILNLLSDCEEKLNLKKSVELSCNPLAVSPMLVGFLRPAIFLPACELDEKELSYVFMHELIHCKKKDIFYKWLIQLVVCVHWFNPFVYLLEKEVNQSCELSCDENVLSMLDDKAKREYGDMLISFLKTSHFRKSSFASVTLTEGAEQLKERLGAIMNYKKKNKAIWILTGVLTMCIIYMAAYTGSYHAAASAPMSANIDASLPALPNEAPEIETLELNGTTYYLVSSEAQLRALGTGAYDMGQNYMQQADIQLSADEWIPIGTRDNPFTGTFNGNGYEIIGLTMTNPDAKLVGLFGVAKNAHIYNITLRDLDILRAGRDAVGKSVGAVLAIGGEVHSDDNHVYPKETGEEGLLDWEYEFSDWVYDLFDWGDEIFDWD